MSSFNRQMQDQESGTIGGRRAAGFFRCEVELPPEIVKLLSSISLVRVVKRSGTKGINKEGIRPSFLAG
jgi:hypothetical protein